MLCNFAKNANHNPLNTFYATHPKQNAAKRIRQVTTPSIYHTTAHHIANVSQKEMPVTHQTLTGLVSVCTKKQTTEIHLKLQSLQDELKVQCILDVNTPVRNSK